MVGQRWSTCRELSAHEAPRWRCSCPASVRTWAAGCPRTGASGRRRYSGHLRDVPGCPDGRGDGRSTLVDFAGRVFAHEAGCRPVRARPAHCPTVSHPAPQAIGSQGSRMMPGARMRIQVKVKVDVNVREVDVHEPPYEPCVPSPG